MAGLNPQALKEASAAGHLPCLPETRPGSRRWFHPDDVAMLSIFADLIARGFRRETAGFIACAVRGELLPGVETVAFFFTDRSDPQATTEIGKAVVAQSDGGDGLERVIYDTEEPRETPRGLPRFAPPGTDPVTQMVFQVGSLRARLTEEAAEHYASGPHPENTG